jgi:hypothetical protein
MYRTIFLSSFNSSAATLHVTLFQMGWSCLTSDQMVDGYDRMISIG